MTKARDLGDFISDGTIAETVTADGLNLGDNEKIQLGASQDLQLYHDGSHSYISDQGTGRLKIFATDLEINNAGNTANYIQAFDGGAVQLFYNNSQKLATTSTGATVTGTIAVSGDFNATSGTFTVQSNGTDILNVTSTEMTPQTDGAISLGSATNGFNNMYLDGSAYVSGSVGIGTSSPNADLELGGVGEVMRLSGSSTNAYIRNTDGTTNQWYIGSGGNAGLQHYIYQAQPMTFHTSGSERMRIDASGNIGIGVTNPSNKFQVSDSAGGSIASFTNTTSADLSINLTSGVSLISPSTGILALGTSNTERFRIGSSGQLGIGGATYGTSGQVLTSGGSGAAPTWADAGGGAFEVVSDNSFTSAGDVEFTITSGRVYKFEFLGITVNNTIGGSQMLWRASSNGGISFSTIYYSVRRSYSSATTFSATNGSNNFGSLTYFNAPQSNSSNSFNGEMFFYQSSGKYPFANSMFQNGDSTPGTSLGGYRVGTTSTINLIRFQPNSDSITGRIRVLRSV